MNQQTINISIKHPELVFNKQIFDSLKDYSSKTEVWYGGASSGKSFGVVQKVILKSLARWQTPRKVLFTRKVQVTIKESIFQDVINELTSLKLIDYCKVNYSDYKITLPNKAVFLFKGLDDPEKIKSITGISDIVMEEASDFNQDDYTQLMLRLRSPKHPYRQMYLMFNPVSKVNWVYKQFFESEPPANTSIHWSTYKDNKFLDAETIQTIEDLKRTHPAYYKIYALGEFATLDKLVFPNITKKRLNPNSSELAQLPSLFGLDFGYVNDPSAFIHIKPDLANKKLYFIEEYVGKGLLNNQIAQAIKDMGYSKEVITADAAEQKSIAEIRRDGINRIRAARKGKDSIVQGLNFMQQFEIIVDDRCIKLIEELENYTYKKDKRTGEYINEPVDSYNHVIDASRYALEEINGQAIPKLKTFRKGV